MEGFHSRSGTVEDLLSNGSEENSSAYNERKIQRWKIQNRLKAIENIIIRSDICLSGVSDDQEKVNGAEEAMIENLFNVMKDFDSYIFKKHNEPQRR